MNISSILSWLTKDPLPDTELSQGTNLYWYVQNNAVTVVDPTGLLGCPCGQHLEFSFEAFSQTEEEMTGGGIVTGADVINKGLTFVPELAADAEALDPLILGYEVGVDTGAALGSWRCVADTPEPPAPPPGYYPTNNNKYRGYNPNYNPFTGAVQ